MALFLVLSLAGAVSAKYGNPPAADAISRGTVPPSRYGSGLVGAPNPMDNTGNLVITGNVSGGKSFRGNIPYNSTASFGGPLGSTSLDPFLRYSALPEELSSGLPTPSPFYSPTGTVSKIQPGYSGVFAPGSPKIAVGVMQSQAEQPADLMLAPETLRPQVSGGRTSSMGDPSAGAWQAARSLPLSRTPEEMRRLVAGEPGAAPADQRPLTQTKQLMTSEEYQRQLEQLQRDLDRVKTNASEFEQNLMTGKPPSVAPAWTQKPLEAVPPLISAEALRKIIQPQSPPQSPSATNPPAEQDLLSKPAALAADGLATPGPMQGQAAADRPELTLASPRLSPTGARAEGLMESRPGLYGPSPSPGPSPSALAAQKSRIDAIFAPQTDGAAMGKGGDNSGKLPAMQRVEETARAFDAPGRLIEHPLQDSTSTVPSSTPAGDEVVPSQSPLPTSSQGAAQQAKAQPRSPGLSPPLPTDRTAPKPGNPAPGAQEKFDGYMRSAQSDMRQGRYARAAESFALACVYNPRDARPQIGRSHALLAAGDYPGSAVCLARAIELDPPSALKKDALRKAELIEAVGGPDAFVQRITDLEQRAEAGKAPGLQLLLAYIYQQMDRSEEATTAIQVAKKGLPSATSVGLLEAAIGNTLN